MSGIMYVGETRTLIIDVFFENDPEFTILDAKYAIYLGEKKIIDGLLNVQEHSMYVQFSPKCAGMFTLEAYFRVNNEEYIRRHNFMVRQGD